MGLTEKPGELRFLNLSNNALDDEAAAEIFSTLYDNVTLKTLHLSQNRIGPDGAISAGKALLFNRTLDSLNLACNRLTARGTEARGIVALCHALEANFALKTVDLSQNML